MKILTVADLRANLKKYLDMVSDEKEIIAVSRGNEKGVAIIPLEEYNLIQKRRTLQEHLHEEICNYFAINNMTNLFISAIHVFSGGKIPLFLSFSVFSEDKYFMDFRYHLNEKRVQIRGDLGQILSVEVGKLTEDLNRIITSSVNTFYSSKIQ